MKATSISDVLNNRTELIAGLENATRTERIERLENRNFGPGLLKKIKIIPQMTWDTAVV